MRFFLSAAFANKANHRHQVFEEMSDSMGMDSINVYSFIKHQIDVMYMTTNEDGFCLVPQLTNKTVLNV